MNMRRATMPLRKLSRTPRLLAINLRPRRARVRNTPKSRRVSAGGRPKPRLPGGQAQQHSAVLFLNRRLEHFSIRLGVARVCEISFAFFFGNPFEKRGDCSPKLLNSARLHFA